MKRPADKFVCPGCQQPSQSMVMDSRTNAGGTEIRRRRRCLTCKARFTTFEQVGRPVADAKVDAAIRVAEAAVARLVKTLRPPTREPQPEYEI